MSRQCLGIALTALFLVVGNSGCGGDIDVAGTEKGSYKYWCTLSGGAWILDEKSNSANPVVGDSEENSLASNEFCQCGSEFCGNGIVCIWGSGDKLTCAGQPATPGQSDGELIEDTPNHEDQNSDDSEDNDDINEGDEEDNSDETEGKESNGGNEEDGKIEEH